MTLLKSFGLEIIYYAEFFINIILGLITLLIMLFICLEWKRPKSIFRNAYFIIFNFSYVIYTILGIFWIYGRIYKYDIENPIMPYVFIIEWYGQCVHGISEFLLGLCRCTALAFPRQHNMLWTERKVIFHLLIIFFFPFTIHGFVMFDFECKFFNHIDEKCIPIKRISNSVIAFVNISLSICSLCFVLLGIISTPKIHFRTNRIKMEQRLALQCVISSTTLIMLYCQTFFLHYLSSDEYYVISYFLYLIQIYPPMIMLVFISSTIQKRFLKLFNFFICKHEILQDSERTDV